MPELLIGWTMVAASWWCIAVLLVSLRRGPARQSGSRDARELISVFRPIPAGIDGRELAEIESALVSLLDDFDDRCELLVGADTGDGELVGPLVASLRDRYPATRIELVVERLGDQLMHPKVRWNRRLAELAHGRWWLWSDADVELPGGTIAALRADFSDGTGMVTTPYVVRRVRSAPDLLDALYVNVEFYPGVLLLGRTGAVGGGLGAGMLFSADEFRRQLDWEELGSHLADDYVMGQRLQPVRLGSVTVATVPGEQGWAEALLHYLRWQKTVRWMQPAGFAAQIVVMPMLGWLAWLVVDATSAAAWAGAAGTLLMESTAALLILRRVACDVPPLQTSLLPAWSVLRALAWLACWVRWPVVWRRRLIWSPRLYEPGTVPAGRPD